MINPEKVAAASADYRAYFTESLAVVDQRYKTLCQEVDSTGSEGVYAFLEELGLPKEWVGAGEYQQLVAQGFTIVNKRWFNGFRVGFDEIEDDKLGIVLPRIANSAQSFDRHRMSLLVDLLVGGFTGTCYDGQTFFSDTHPGAAGATAQDNKAAVALDATNFNAAMAAMMKFKDFRGEELGITPTHLVVGPSTRALAHAVLEAEYLASGATNTNYHAVELMIHPRIRTASWFLLDLSKPIKPFIMQNRKSPEIGDLERVPGEPWYRMDCDSRYNAGYGHWTLAYGSTQA